MYRKQINNIEPIIGFASNHALDGETVDIVVKDFLTSDDSDFHYLLQQTTSHFLKYKNTHVLPNDINSFLIIWHDDGMADVFINNFVTIALCRAKVKIEPGSLVDKRDILDIVELSFKEISIAESDSILYCFKQDWKFGFFFDLHHKSDTSYVLDISNLRRELARYHRYLAFESVYVSKENKPLFSEITKDGWFPFIQLIGGEYDDLVRAYGTDNREGYIKSILDKFDEKRVKEFTDYWWNNELFSDKRLILEAGMNEYLENTNKGNINCIKNLFSEIDGILRLIHPPCASHQLKTTDLRNNLLRVFSSKCDPESLLLGREFDHYLKYVFYKGFDLSGGGIELSRPSSCHGVAEVESYDRAHALQSILILDQIYFYIS